MRILAIADIDELHWSHDSVSTDVLMSCGDVYDQVILEAGAACGCQRIFAVKGNHDSANPFPEPIIDLHLAVYEFNGFTFGGMNGCCKYKPCGPFLYDQEEATVSVSNLSAVDIFLSHNSPRGIHDRDDGAHVGFEGLKEYINDKKPKVLIHGHQHLDNETIVSKTRVVRVYGWKIIEV